MRIVIVANEKANPPGKLADVELHFEGMGVGLLDWLLSHQSGVTNLEAVSLAPKVAELQSLGALSGLKLIGFAVWERTGGGRTVTYPSRSFAINGERRSYALLRPAGTGETGALTGAILAAYAAYEEARAVRAAGAAPMREQAGGGKSPGGAAYPGGPNLSPRG